MGTANLPAIAVRPSGHRAGGAFRDPAVLGTFLLATALGWCSPSETGTLHPNPSFDPKIASLEELFFHAQRYATTPDKRQHKDQARTELFGRGAEALAFLIRHAEVENPWYFMLADELVSRLSQDQGVPALLALLDGPSVAVRKTALFFLGQYDAPQHAARILPFLEDDALAGVAARTLGRWRVREAVPALIRMLTDPKERRRIAAANALGRIRDPAAIPPLIAALDDPLFTVRTTAARALSMFGGDAEEPLLQTLAEGSRIRCREAIRLLGTVGSARSDAVLQAYLSSPDRGLREDAAAALAARIEPVDPPKPPAERQLLPMADGTDFPANNPALEDEFPVSGGLVRQRPPQVALVREDAGRTGPFPVAEKAEWIVGGDRYRVVQVRDEWILLQAVKTGKLLDPFPGTEGATVNLSGGAWRLERVPPRIFGVVATEGLVGGRGIIHLVKVTPTVTEGLARLRETYRMIREALAIETAPVRLRTPTIEGMPGLRRSPWIHPSSADQARARRVAAGRAIRALDEFLEQTHLESTRLGPDGTFVFAQLTPGRYFVCVRASGRAEAGRGGTPLIAWADCRMDAGSIEIRFEEKAFLTWDELFPL